MLQIEPAPPAWQDDDVAALMADTPVPWADSWVEGDLQEPSPFAGMDHLGELTGQQVFSEDQQQVSDLRKGCRLDPFVLPSCTATRCSVATRMSLFQYDCCPAS